MVQIKDFYIPKPLKKGTNDPYDHTLVMDHMFLMSIKTSEVGNNCFQGSI